METRKFLAKQDIEEKVFYIWEDFFEGNFVRAFVRNIDSFYLEDVSKDLRVEVEYDDFDPKTLLIRGYDKDILKQEVEIGDQESFDEFSDKLNLVIEALGLNETEEVYYTGAIYNIEQIAQDFEEDKEVVLLKGLIDLRDSGLMVPYYRPGDREIIATGTKEQFKEFVKTNEYMSEYDWHAYGGGGAMVEELIAMESLWVDDNVENAKRYSTNIDNVIRDLIADLPEEKINKLNENSNNQEYEYRLLSRLVSDCKYFLGHGNCNEAHSLWGITIENHIKTMHDLYDSLIVKPEWLTKEDINDYETKLYNCKPKYDNFGRVIKEQENKTLNEAEEVFLDEMRYKDYVIELFKDTQDEKYYWQAEYGGDDRNFSNFNALVAARGISLYSDDDNAYPTKANAMYHAIEWVDEQKRRWEGSLAEATLEEEVNKMSLEQRVISVLDEHNYLEKIREYTYVYYYDKDYRDKLDLDTIDNLVAAAQRGDLTDAWLDLTSNFDDAGYILEYITKGVVEELEKVAPLTNEEFNEVSQLLWDFIQIDYSAYLDDEVPVYIMVDTGDGNYDFTLNPNYSFNWDGETVEDEPLELASLTWLAGTQGYTLDQVLEAFREGGSNNKFLNSVVREGLNNSTSMSAVTFLGTMRILDLLNAASGNGDVTINTDTYVGLFDTWGGSGSLFDIELERSLVIPGNIINRIGTAGGRGDNGYTPDQVYGFSGRVYDSKINLLNDLGTNVLEEQEKTKELDWLLNLPEGFVVAISACRGKDCSRTGELEERLRRYNYIRVVGKWNGVEEISFLVYTRTREEAKKLINLGTKTFDQDDVYVWETPMDIKDITKNTSDEGTKLDGDYYFFDLDKIILKRSDLEKIKL